jgi:hypothetical protein
LIFQGLIHSFGGRVGICLVLAFFGLLGSLALTVLFALRTGAGWRTRINRVTDERVQGRIIEFLGWAAILMGPPMLALVAVMSVELVHRLPVWVWPVGVAVAALIVGVVWLRSLPERHLPPPKVIPAPTPPVPPGWSMPERVEQWDK